MVDQLLGGLFGSNDADDVDTQRRRARDFADRAERNPHDLDPNEVMQNYQATTSRLTSTSVLLKKPSARCPQTSAANSSAKCGGVRGCRIRMTGTTMTRPRC